MDDLTSQAELGLPYAPKQVLRRAAMNIPWKMFVGRQVEFNRSLVSALNQLEERLDRRFGAAVEAVRATVFDHEGSLKSELVALEQKVARLEAQLREMARD